MRAQDPLAQLRDIQPPDPIGWWPPAPGWWLLAVLVLLIGAVLALYAWRRHRRNAYRRAARQELSQLWQAYQANGDAVAYVTALNQLLRRTARVAFPACRADINRLQGEAWLDWLDQSLANPHHPDAFRQGPGQHLLTVPYRPNSSAPDLAPLQQLAEHWLQQHQPQLAPPQVFGGAHAGV